MTHAKGEGGLVRSPELSESVLEVVAELPLPPGNVAVSSDSPLRIAPLGCGPRTIGGSHSGARSLDNPGETL